MQWIRVMCTEARNIGALLAMLLGLLAAAGASGCEKTVRWAEDPPFDMRTEQGQLHGVYTDLMREALLRMGCTARFVEMPWARGLLSLQRGSLDILPGALPTAERRSFAFFSMPFIHSPNVLFVSRAAAGKYHFQRLEDLIGTDFRLGAQIDVVYSGAYKRLLQNPAFRERLVMISSREGAWKMIEAGRLDGMIADEITGVIELNKLGLSAEVRRSGLIVADEPAVVAFSRTSVSADFVQQFDQVLSGMLRDGSWEHVVQAYLPCPVSADQLGCR